MLATAAAIKRMTKTDDDPDSKTRSKAGTRSRPRWDSEHTRTRSRKDEGTEFPPGSFSPALVNKFAGGRSRDRHYLWEAKTYNPCPRMWFPFFPLPKPQRQERASFTRGRPFRQLRTGTQKQRP